MNKILPAFVLAAFTLVAGARRADACGTDPKAEVQSVLQNHFASVNAHDRKAVLALWTPSAPVTTVGIGKTKSVTVPIERAVDRWVGAKELVSFEIEDVKLEGQDAVARLRVAFEGKPWADTVKLHLDDKGAWHIVEKSTRQLAGAASDSPY